MMVVMGSFKIWKNNLKEHLTEKKADLSIFLDKLDLLLYQFMFYRVSITGDNDYTKATIAFGIGVEEFLPDYISWLVNIFP